MSDHDDQLIREPLVRSDDLPPVRRRAERLRPNHETALRSLLAVLALVLVTAILFPRGSWSLPPSLARLLTPAPTATPRPGHFVTSPWELVSLPPDSNGAMPVPSPHDPSTLYACAAGIPDDTGRMTDGPATLWVTHDAGHSWASTRLTLLNGVSCGIASAPVDPAQLILTINTGVTSDTDRLFCPHQRYFTSHDGGVTWAEVPHAALEPIGAKYDSCDLWVTPGHIYLSTYSQLTVDSTGQTRLERSDDGSQTWTRADMGLPPQGYDISATGPDSLLAVPFTSLSSPTSSTTLWASDDAGRSWHRAATIPEGSWGQVITNFRVDPAHLGCTCFFVAGGSDQFFVHLYTSSTGTQWTPLSPLPVPGATQSQTGLDLVVGLTTDERLLVFGADPARGVPTDESATELALWAWDTHQRQWEASSTPLPCIQVASCYGDSPGLSYGVGPDGATLGTWAWMWLSTGGGKSRELYRVFVPTQ